MEWQRLRYNVPNFKHDKRRKYGWRSFETFPQGHIVEVWFSDEGKPSVWFGTSQVEDRLVERMILEACEPAVGTTFDEIKMIQGLRYTSGSVVIDYAMKHGWLTEAQVIQALKSDE
jgi:hypothetical protein